MAMMGASLVRSLRYKEMGRSAEDDKQPANYAANDVDVKQQDAAGKTTILYKLKLGEIVTTIPTIGKLSVPCGLVQQSNVIQCSWHHRHRFSWR
jgi:hypothetical protein